MKDVSMIGLGPMGIALVRALLRGGSPDPAGREGGSRITVWNRTATKANALVHEGAILAPSLVAAVSASPLVIVCVADYAATHALLETPEVARALAGKVLVQLSTGTPEDARRGEAWAQKRGADYLDGAILAVPSQVGRPESTLFVSGSATALETSEPLLKRMAGTVAYHGDRVGTASALDLAFLSYLFGGLLGFYHGARICEAEGLRVDAFGEMIGASAHAAGEIINNDGALIQAGRFENPQSSLKTCWTGMELIARHAREAKINGEFPRFAAALFEKGMKRGLGEQSSAALVQVLREGL
jgi:3-hydroxyisobutyrate dehydrogenase-like beta-hydroxyacid dehydrogenase